MATLDRKICYRSGLSCSGKWRERSRGDTAAFWQQRDYPLLDVHSVVAWSHREQLSQLTGKKKWRGRHVTHVHAVKLVSYDDDDVVGARRCRQIVARSMPMAPTSSSAHISVGRPTPYHCVLRLANVVGTSRRLP